MLLGGIDLLDGIHSCDLDIAPEGNQRLDAVLRLPTAERPQPRSEAGKEFGHLHIESLGRGEVRRFMKENGGEQSDDDCYGSGHMPSLLRDKLAGETD